MSFDFNDFNSRDVQPRGDMSEPIPAGQYRAQIVKGEWKANSKNTGRYLELVFEVKRGEHEGRRVWARLNLENPSMKAVSMAEADLKAICNATGVKKPRNEQQLFDIAMVIDVVVAERKDKPGDYTNEIKAWHSLEDAMKEARPQTVAAGASGDDSAPWE
jgi:signal recognition particle subunit SEC65